MNRFVLTGSFAAWGVTLLTPLLLCGPVSAADLPLVTKAPPLAEIAFWAELDYLVWTVKGDRLPPLVTNGTLGAPGTSILFGNSTVNDGWRSGGRLQAGYWFDPTHMRGIEASAFAMQNASTGFIGGSNATGLPVLSRPFFNVLTNLQDSVFVAAPGVAAGSISAGETSRLYGAGALYRQTLGTLAGASVSGLIGYRYLHASDRLSIITSAASLSLVIPPGTMLTTSDAFAATSNFHGLDLGLIGQFNQGPWRFEWRGKVALGANFNDAQINGSNSVTVGGITTTTAGGMLALSSNIGGYSQTRFAAVPSVELKVGYQLTPQWRFTAGYEALYWTGVERVGGLIDQSLNPNLLLGGVGGGPERPQPVLDTSSLLAQGFTFAAKHAF